MCGGRCRCLSPSRLPFGSQRHSDAHQDMLQSLVGLRCASGHIVSPGALAYIHSGRASVSEGHHREDTRETLAFSTSPSWNCVVVCPVHCSRQSSFAVLGETMLPLTSNPWDRINLRFAENSPAHPNSGCHSGASGWHLLGHFPFQLGHCQVGVT